jgi:hypothetical protein
MNILKLMNEFNYFDKQIHSFHKYYARSNGLMMVYFVMLE